MLCWTPNLAAVQYETYNIKYAVASIRTKLHTPACKCCFSRLCLHASATSALIYMSRCLRDHNEYYPLQMSNHLWSHAIYWWVWESAGLCRHTPVVGLSHGYTPCLVSRDKGCTRQDVHLILPSWVVIQSPYLPSFMFHCQIYCVMGPGSWTLGFVFYVSSLFLLVFGKWFMFRFCSLLHSLWNFVLYFSWCYLLGPIQLTVCFLLVF